MVKNQRLFFIALSLIFVTLLISLLAWQLPDNQSLIALFLPSESLALLLLQSYTLPRICIALIAGGILGIASLLLQQVIANPLASDNTIGISAGAQFSLFVCAIFMPGLLENGATLIALLGAGLSLALVLALAWRKTMSPLLLILAGLVVNLYLGSFSAIMMLFYPEESRGLAQWGAGSLAQESWRNSQWLFMQALPLLGLIALLRRPLAMLSLNEDNARSLGLPVGRLRFIGILIGAYLIAAVVSAVGMLGFIGLAAATLVRQLGIRTFQYRLIGAFSTGALLLSITDLSLQLLALFKHINLPTGAVTSLLGTPLLLWLMFRALPDNGRIPQTPYQIQQIFKPHYPIMLSVALFAAVVIALSLGKSGNQWHWSAFSDPLLTLRYPRILTAAAVGVLLATAGVFMQRLTLNPMASPELLGVSSGTGMGVLVALFLFSATRPAFFWAAGIIGAIIALFILSAINQRNGMLPEKVLLTGISLSALFSTMQSLVIASGDPRVSQLIAWTSGSTQQADMRFALPFLLFSLGLLALSLLFSRWLELLALQAPIAQSLGLNLLQTRWILILFSALLTALATLIIGPLSFIGLLVPHLTRFFGVTKASRQILFSALLGCLIMIIADWCGRQLLFPYEIPAGLVVTLVGGSYFLLAMRKI
ncbi:Fe(3+)-hydroxamate ABC transporter permease FhuB [Necropsobacter massiliensis]|uniref:Fe(3+)-hydroxamate ABC transporter permease FhuB n=1 Tax=Necropsobacter massiliensis TaxID=1400001 RepID=UPI000595AAA0|nr:Fe(3+)-hydroxamate ABC transporter permease FhuB [Necropsobacter massiliensis]